MATIGASFLSAGLLLVLRPSRRTVAVKTGGEFRGEWKVRREVC